MTWATIIGALIAMFGPAIADWVAKWLDSLFKRAAAKMPPAAKFKTNSDRVSALFAKSRSLLGVAPARRALLKVMEKVVLARGGDLVTPLSAKEKAGVKASAADAANE